MRKQHWRIIQRMHDRFVNVVDEVLKNEEVLKDEEEDEEEETKDEADAESAVALAYTLLMRGLGYALEVLGKPERRSFRRLTSQLPLMVPPLSRDYTDLFIQVRSSSKKVTYFEEDVEILETLEAIADEVKEFIDELRSLAKKVGDAAA